MSTAVYLLGLLLCAHICSLETIMSSTGKLFSGEAIRNAEEFGRRLSHPQTLTKLPGKDCEKWGVVTTIFAPTESVKQFHSLPNWCLVVVADRNGPATYPLNPGPHFVYLTVQLQQDMMSTFIDLVPWNHFGRKSIGYLYAIQHGARQIWDFDDDNLLTQPAVIDQFQKHFGVGGIPVFNPYIMFDKPGVSSWPRGYPINKVNDQGSPTILPVSHNSTVVFQSLAQHDPDIDAIYRMTRVLPLNFRNESLLVSCGHNVLAPYNAQASLHLYDAFWALLLPISVPGRVSDIWRSYFAQPLFWRLNIHLGFTSPQVVQYRNAHNYLADFAAEQALYLQTDKLVSFLQEYHFDPWSTSEGAFLQMWLELYDREYIGKEDVILVSAWLDALNLAGYQFPQISHIRTLNEETCVAARRDSQIMEIIIVVVSKLESHWLNQIRSINLFVSPDLFRFTLVVDPIETEIDFGHRLAQMAPYPCVKVAPPHMHAFEHMKGKFFGQATNFYMDMFTDAKMIAIADADAVWYTYAVPEDFIDPDGKVHVHGIKRGRWAEQCDRILKLDCIYDFMVYFPVVIPRHVFPLLRDHVARAHGKPFAEVLSEVTNEFPQFHILLNFAWHQLQDEFIWHIATDGEPWPHIQGHTKRFNPEPMRHGLRHSLRDFSLAPNETSVTYLELKAWHQEMSRLTWWDFEPPSRAHPSFLQHYRNVDQHIQRQDIRQPLVATALGQPVTEELIDTLMQQAEGDVYAHSQHDIWQEGLPPAGRSNGTTTVTELDESESNI